MPAAPTFSINVMRRAVLAPALVLFTIMVAHALLETARDALFIANLGPEWLAWAYIAIAAAALIAVVAMRRWAGGRDPRRLLIGFLGIATIGTGSLAAMLAVEPSVAFALYVWSGVIVTLIVPSFWLVIDRSLRLAEAKRVFAAIGAGGGLGALVGSAMASGLGLLIDARHLVTMGATMYLIAVAVTSLLLPRTRSAPEPVLVLPARAVRPGVTSHSTRYVRLLLILGLVSTLAITLGDLMFKRLLAERLPVESLATVFGAVYTGFNVIGLAVQLALTPRLLERLGVGVALTVLPVIVLASTLGFVITGTVIAVIALKLADGGLRFSVYRIANEILFLPIATALRDARKPLIDAVGQRGGQALAAIATFAVASGAEGTWMLGVLTALAVTGWLVVIGFTRAAYVQQFRDTLDAGDILRDGEIPPLDADSVALLTASLASSDEPEALAALDLLSQRGDAIPAHVLYHPSAAVVRRALSLIEGGVRDDVVGILAQLTEHPDPQLRAAALAASSRTSCNTERLVAALTDREPDVRAAAAVGLTCAPGNVAADAELAQLVAGSTAERAAVAHAISRWPHERFRPLLIELASRREPVVIREVLRVWEHAPQLADFDHLLRLLDDPHVRGAARRVFVAGDHLAPLIAALDDPRVPLGIRRHLPRTIGMFGPPAAAPLVARLLREPDGTTEFKILRALGRVRADYPPHRIDTAPVERYVRRSLQDAARYLTLRVRLAVHNDASPTGDLLAALLVEKRLHAIERVFRGLGVLSPAADLRSIHDALLANDDPDRRSAAREILDELVPGELRVPLLAAIDGRDLAAPRLYPSHADIVTALLSDPSDSVRCIAAHHVAERHLVMLRAELLRLKPLTGSALVTHAFEQAIERLDA
ncbi:MAG: hypothetical protein H0T89_16380 [Deltaproteobacteria bacterium]|nr:hypothetical protein [Deltaproteobacteria bacterium]MDQ3299359.1 hypothetical protein [Myxococcota bacterium]